MIRQFQITTSGHGMPSIQIENPTEAERNFLRRAVLTQMMDDVFYINKQGAQPFLQSDSENFILIEFWGKKENAQLYVDWLNNSQCEEVVKTKFFCAT